VIAFDITRIDFAKGDGLVCAVVQDVRTLQVLMVAWMDRAALEETLQSGEATFYSRSRQTRWRKGETSGNRLHVTRIEADCSPSNLLVLPAISAQQAALAPPKRRVSAGLAR
jgi:phosphoribosyl-ATP pyrophosphohydrolase/phosphoribosyl-AMP cyclohydrolase